MIELSVGMEPAATFISCMRSLITCLSLLFGPAVLLAGPPLDLSKVDSLDLTGYRTLVREDFRGNHAPAQFLHSRILPVAVSCIHVVVNPQARVYAERVATDSTVTFVSRISDLAFQAVLSRTCSWWNEQHDVSPAYVLEHEQIHFALYEIAARRLNKQSRRLIRALPSSTVSPQAAVTAAQQFLHSRLDRTMQSVVEENLRFDRETSFGFQPDRQRRWRASAEADLKDLSPHAAGLNLRPPEAR